MKTSYQRISPGNVSLLPGLFQQRSGLNRKYMLSLDNEKLLQNFYLEAGLTQASFRASSMGDTGYGDDWHWGWESPTCQLRGHFLGHWLSAAAQAWASNGDAEMKAKADVIVSGLGRCQKENGGEWAGSIPEKYFDWIAHGKKIWAPHYTIHKTMMGLFDMAVMAGNSQALEILERFADWFYRWTGKFSRTEMDDILDVETGGMLEVWADLYGLTQNQKYLDLFLRYERRRLFARLLAGEDPLTNRHANTTIPEIHGVARMYEVTGENRWRDIVESYWKCAVTNRGAFCTGSQTSGEIWTPPFEFSDRLGDKNQEHCVVYNMIRLADFILRWTGEAGYADYIERNLYNGILAQQNPDTGMVCYFLPMAPGSVKRWGSPTNDFWCCHGTLVQAQASYPSYVYYEDEKGLVVSQYIPTELRWEWQGIPVRIWQVFDQEASTSQVHLPDQSVHRPEHWVVDLVVSSEHPVNFDLKLRMPGWLYGAATVLVNGQPQEDPTEPSGYWTIQRDWNQDNIRIILPKQVSVCPLPDKPDSVAFMDGPVVLAGLCDEERTLYTRDEEPGSILVPDDVREWNVWKPGYRTRNQDRGLRFIPLYEVRDEKYAIYFPIKKAEAHQEQ
jgi:DUF1680 family protein